MFGDQLRGPVPAPAPPLAARLTRLCPTCTTASTTPLGCGDGRNALVGNCASTRSQGRQGPGIEETLQQLRGAAGRAGLRVDRGRRRAVSTASGTQANLQVRYPTDSTAACPCAAGQARRNGRRGVGLRPRPRDWWPSRDGPSKPAATANSIPSPGERSATCPSASPARAPSACATATRCSASAEQLDAAGAGEVAAPGMTLETPLLGVGALAPRDTSPCD